MKPIALTFLATSLVLTHFAAAEDTSQAAQGGRKSAAASRAPARPAPQARRTSPAPGVQRPLRPTLATPTVRSQPWQGAQRRFDSDVPQSPWGRNPIITTPTPRVTEQNTAQGAAPATSPAAPDTSQATRDARNRAGAPARDRQDRTRPAGDRNWRDGTGHNREWRNRNGGDNADERDHRDRHRRHWHHRDWDRHHHHRDWWRNHYTRFVLFGGGYYYWNSGFWYPAYGYDPYFNSYAYDAPIYGYNDLPPEQVMANVQAELSRLGYYHGAIDGTYGPQTRAALLSYQQAYGLPVTGMLDQATVESLGMY